MQTEALVVGAGPTGLLMAAELARQNVKCRVIDKAAAPTDKSKALVLQARTLEIFDYLGIVEPFLEQGLKLKGANPTSKHKSLAHVCFKDLDSPFPFILSLEQSKTEELLGRHLSSEGITVEREMELVDFKEENEEIEATLRNNLTGAEERIKTHWLIGCDGAHSFVRKQLGLAFHGKVFSDIFSLADVRIDWEHPHDEVVVFLEPEGVMAAFPIPGDDRYRLIFQLKRCRDLLHSLPIADQVISSEQVPDPTVEETQEILTRYAGEKARISHPLWMANFHINSRMTEHYRRKRVFLAGDAAHIHSPVGGQGMNTGLQDAFNLAWKLALVTHNKAKDSLLDTYEIERQAVGKALLKATEQGTVAATLHNPFLVSARNTVVPLIAKSPRVQKKLATAISQIGIQYPKSSLVVEKGSKGLIGLRAPDGVVKHQGQNVHLFSLFKEKKGFQIVFFCGEHMDSTIKTVIQQLPVDLCHVFVVLTRSYPADEIENALILEDEGGKVHQLYDAKRNTLFVIRPDGYIGFGQHPIDATELSRYFSGFFNIAVQKEQKIRL